MIVAFDATMLILMFDLDAAAPKDKQTGKPVEDCRERLTYLIQTLGKIRGSRIIFPTPAVSEFLIRIEAEKAPEYISNIERLRGAIVASFDKRAALEFAEMQRLVIFERRRKVPKGGIESRAKVKFDQQIVAIAKVEGVSVIYTDDKGLGTFAKRFGIKPIGIGDLPLSPETRQGLLPLEPPEPAPPHPDDEGQDTN